MSGFGAVVAHREMNASALGEKFLKKVLTTTVRI
jgi:hypothetical protein